MAQGVTTSHSLHLTGTTAMPVEIMSLERVGDDSTGSGNKKEREWKRKLKLADLRILGDV